MRSLGRIFVSGLLTLLPILLTVYLVAWFVAETEAFFGAQLKRLISEEHYYPGMGIALAIALVLAVGALLRTWMIRRLFRLGEKGLMRLPVVRSIYSTMRDLSSLLSSPEDDRVLQVVSVRLGDGLRALGFVTRVEFAGLPAGIGGKDEVAVYLPMSYQIGGYMLFVRRERLTPIEMSREDAMRFMLTAGVHSKSPFVRRKRS